MRLAVFLVGLASIAQAHDFITTRITWTREVSRLFYAHCVSCHRDGGSAFSLVKYEEARPWAKAIKEEVLTRRMPPWNAVKGFGEFKDDHGLTQEQIEVIAQWVEGGAPEGEPAYLPKVPPPPETSSKKDRGVPTPVKGSLTLARSMIVAGVQAGAVPKGGAIQVIATRPDGAVEPLLWVMNFNPAYKQPYWFKTPLQLPPGTRISTVPPSSSITLFAR